MISKFAIPKAENQNLEKYQFHWLYTNGLLAEGQGHGGMAQVCEAYLDLIILVLIVECKII